MNRPLPFRGGAVPFDGMEQYSLDKLNDQELDAAIRDENTPRWMKDELEMERRERERLDYYG